MNSHCPALEIFNNRLTEIEVLLSLSIAQNANLKRQSRSRERNGALCRAALVLLCSHMEGFFEDVIENVLRFHELNLTAVPCLPLRLRVLQIWRHLDAMNSAPDDKKWEAIQAVRRSTVADVELRCDDGTLNLDLHTRGFSTPGSKDVEKLFHSVGIEDIWGAIETKLPSSRIYRNSLDGLVNRRHPIAHGDAGATATPQDVRQYVSDMKTLAATFDEIAAEHLSKKCSVDDPWAVLGGG